MEYVIAVIVRNELSVIIDFVLSQFVLSAVFIQINGDKTAVRIRCGDFYAVGFGKFAEQDIVFVNVLCFSNLMTVGRVVVSCGIHVNYGKVVAVFYGNVISVNKLVKYRLFIAVRNVFEEYLYAVDINEVVVVIERFGFGNSVFVENGFSRIVFHGNISYFILRFILYVKRVISAVIVYSVA